MLQSNSLAAQLLDNAFDGQWVLLINSYCAAEAIGVLQRLENSQELESRFWNLLAHPQIEQVFTVPITKALVTTLRRASYIMLIGSILDIEPKDVPYLLTAYEKNCWLVTEDIRSLWSKRDIIRNKTGIIIKKLGEILGEK